MTIPPAVHVVYTKGVAQVEAKFYGTVKEVPPALGFNRNTVITTDHGICPCSKLYVVPHRIERMGKLKIRNVIGHCYLNSKC